MLKRVRKWLSERPAIQRFNRHRKEFKYIWILLLVLVGTCLLVYSDTIQWSLANSIISKLLYIVAALFLIRPMNAVYGLMGTSGSIPRFFLNFLFITFLFACVYYWAFFNNAGISYDVNQPHIDFQRYAVTAKADTPKTDSPIINISTKRDTVYVEHQLDSTSYTETIIQTQESADLLAIATVHNEAMESTNVGIDKEKSELFEWILIFHIIISWIFFGVFISLIYNKFRYES